MPTFDARTPMSVVADTVEGLAILQNLAPDLMESPASVNQRQFPIRSLLKLILGEHDARVDVIIEKISQLEDTRPIEPEEPAIDPDPNYEPASIARASARVEIPSDAERGRRVDVLILGPSHGNPFVDVELTAEFTSGEGAVRVGGFYDGDGRYILRFLPLTTGEWKFRTTSTARSLDGITGAVMVSDSNRHGPVRVADTFHFAYDDGTPYTPVGTTAYVWTHQGNELEEETLRSLASAPFTKLRMCVFPKDFLYNSNEPEYFVFPRGGHGDWDTERFDLGYWRHLEQRIEQLDELGVEADIIVFHPYDRWGFSTMSRAADDRYVRYLSRRLSGFANVWWSLANEYDLLISKSPEDWDRLARLIRAEDHAGHLTSIHNFLEMWDYSSDWATHCSLQRGENLGREVETLRRRWGKPVLVDECGYEGDLDQGWGSMISEELVHRFWEITLGGGYATHGETYYDADEIIWWSKGGTLRGSSPARFEFLKRIVAESPTGRLDPLPSEWDSNWGGVQDEYAVAYYGTRRPIFRDVVIPDGMTAEIDILDMWNMTVEPWPGIHSGTVRVPLPARQYTAVRLRAI